MPIRRKLTLLFGGLLSLVVIMFGLVVLNVVRWAMIDTIDATLATTANYIVDNSITFRIPSELGGDFIYDVKIPPLDAFRSPGVYVQVWQMVSGSMVFSGSSSNLGNYRRPLDSTTLGTGEWYFNDVLINETQWRVLTRPITILGGTLWGNVQVTASLETVNETTNRLVGILVITTGVSLVGVGGLGWWFSQRALKPIDRISEAAAHIADAEDLGTRLEWAGPADELGRLVSVFNHMMARLERSFKVQQRFVADVSHELRTPLTAIRGNIELINRYGMDSASLAAIDSETERMSRMVNDLLLLARADYGSMQIDTYPLDLDTVVSDVYQQARVLAKDRDLEIKMAFFEPMKVIGNADRIKQLTFNLVINAIKYTPDGGTITMGLRREGDFAVLQVRDTGIGIPAKALPHIFDRFYQVDKARTHGDESVGTGAGLGLSIARWIVDAHNGSISVDSTPEQGSTFTVKIPVTPEECLTKESGSGKHHNGRPRIPLIGR